MRTSIRTVAVICCIAAFSVVGGGFPCDVESFFASPQVDGVVENQLVAEILAASESILIAMYNLTDDQLGAALIEAKNSGTTVTILVDREALTASGSEVDRLVKEGISVLSSTSGGAFHHKFAIIDSVTVVTGSYNWTEAANKDNYENVVIVRCADIAQRFIDQWNYLLAAYVFIPVPSASPSSQGSSGTCAYIGNKNSKVFHYPSCSSVRQMSEKNKVCLTSRDAAIAAGYKPCGNCKP